MKINKSDFPNGVLFIAPPGQNMLAMTTPMSGGKELLAVSCVAPNETAEQAVERMIVTVIGKCDEIVVSSSMTSLFGDDNPKEAEI